MTRVSSPTTGCAAFLYEPFGAAPFGGNMAGVVFLEGPASEQWMRGVAADLGAPTTGFVDLPSGRQYNAHVRFFTPRQEIDACGHVTVAVATALAETGIWAAQDVRHASVTARGGEFPLRLETGTAGGKLLITVSQKLVELATPLSLDVSPIVGKARLSRNLPITIAGTGLRHLLVPVERLDDLAELVVTADQVARLSHAHRVDTIGVFALVGRRDGVLRVRMRDLCAGIGALEEPASGTTCGALAFTLAALHVMDEGTLLEVEMGVEMGRPSRLSVRVDFDAALPRAAHVTGSAHRVLVGTIQVLRGADAERNEGREGADRGLCHGIVSPSASEPHSENHY
jgi:trans-2,3-dihydro-3-hydroxyanthranilate isomerase